MNKYEVHRVNFFFKPKRYGSQIEKYLFSLAQ